ncbi:MAG: hypothetical protein UFJ18_06715 [Blautia sp.]|nr:hypothetical protein [Blautia sp.]
MTGADRHKEEKMRYTEYHNGVAVIKDKALLKEAMAKLAKIEDEEEMLELRRKAQNYCDSHETCNDFCILHQFCNEKIIALRNLKELRELSKLIDEVSKE